MQSHPRIAATSPRTSLSEVCHVIVPNPLFDFATYLENAINCDGLDYTSPPASPSVLSASLALSPQDLDDLSPLTTPDSSPCPSPMMSSRQLDSTLPPTSTETLPPPPPSFTTTSTIEPQPSLKRSSSSVLPKASKPRLDTDKKASKKPEDRKARHRAAQKAWRIKKRIEERDSVGNHYKARENAHRKHVESAGSLECSWDASEAAVTSTGYVAARDGRRSKRQYGLEELVGKESQFKFQKVEWNGSTPTAIIDVKKRIVCILAGHPDDPAWPTLHAAAAQALELRRKRCYIPKKCRKHRRGAFVALNCGVSHGGGQKEPGNLRNDYRNAEVLQELNEMEPFQRLSGFSSSIMATWAPDLHDYYSKTIDTLHSNHPSLKRIFSSSVFSRATYNLGPQTVCNPHTDPGNLAYGMCSVTPLGDFDSTQGGHLVLWDLHSVVEFPAGSTILLPSAIVTHSNVKIAEHEKRYSFTQYTAGALFRWADNDCKTKESYLSLLSEKDLEDDRARNAARWQFGLSLIPTYTPPEKESSEVEGR